MPLFRKAEKKDMPEVTRLLQKLANIEDSSGKYKINEHELEKLFASKESPFDVLICHTDNNKDNIIGIATWTKRFSTFSAKYVMFVSDCYIKEEYRGQNIGTDFFIELKRIAQENGFSKMEWLVNRNRPDVHQFYTRMGAKENPTFNMWEMDVK